MTFLPLSKHHGLGNDFLVAVVDDDTRLLGHDDDATMGAHARRWCHRRTGIGADGLLLALALSADDGPASVRMVLYNADGTRAEMSGNGIRCLAHAVARRRDSLEPLVVATDAGIRRVELVATDDPAVLSATAEMGEVAPIGEPVGWAAVGIDPGRPVAHLGLGNPHTVVPVEDVDAVDLAAIGERIAHVNLEIVEATAQRDTIRMRVHERGVGITAACGTGACAAAVAATRWGLAVPTDEKVVVVMDGGSATVVFAERGERAVVRLEGTTTHVADITVALPSTVNGTT